MHPAVIFSALLMINYCENNQFLTDDTLAKAVTMQGLSGPLE